MSLHVPLFSDRALAQRLERTEARANAAFVEARARSEPGLGACWTDVAGTWAMFDGAGSPLTQTFGLGLFEPVGDHELSLLEAFFHSRGADVFHEVSPMADPGLLALLTARGYVPLEFSSVLTRATEAPIDDAPRDLASGVVTVRAIDARDAMVWCETSVNGWRSEGEELAEFVRQFGALSSQAAGTTCFLAEQQGVPIGAAAMSIFGDVALLAGASTVPAGRRQGAQRALLAARLRHAAAAGVPLAMMAAAPGSASQRNAERQGFRMAYTRLKWRLVPHQEPER